MMDEFSCDVLVIGAGPAGSTAARFAAQAGASVILVERKEEVGVPVQCAGYVSRAIRWHVNLSAECVFQPLDSLRTHLPDGEAMNTEFPGYILDRAALDKRLATEAVEAGAQLLLGTRAIGRDEAGVVARRGNRSLLIRAAIVVGADGPRSLVSRWMGLPLPRLARAIQYEVALQSRMSVAEVYFRPVFRGGYAWFFPAGGKGRVGAAFVDGVRGAATSLKGFLQELESGGRVAGPVLSRTAGFVPVGGPTKLCDANMLLVGDAGGHTHPITGAGILNAIISGEMAGRWAAEAASARDMGRLREYEEEWQEVFGSSMGKALEKRLGLEEKWDSPATELSQSIRESWIGFDDYYSRY